MTVIISIYFLYIHINDKIITTSVYIYVSETNLIAIALPI